MGEFISTIYSRKFKPQKVQARELAAALKSINSEDHELLMPGLQTSVVLDAKSFLLALAEVMSRQPQTKLTPPSIENEPSVLDEIHHLPVSLSLIELKTWSSRPEGMSYEMHVRAEASLGAALVTWLTRCCPQDDIFVATPHRVQRQAVKSALARIEKEEGLEEAFRGLDVRERGTVTVDTVERLQGSEAGFVICLFSVVDNGSSGVEFLLQRRRLNVSVFR